MADPAVVDQGTQDTTTTTVDQKPGATDPQKSLTSAQDTKPDQKPVKDAGQDRRDQGILSDLKKERQARQALEARIVKAEANYEAERRRVQALAGVNPKSPEELDADETRGQLTRLVPWIGKLSDEKVDKLLSLLDNSDSAADFVDKGWLRHGKSMLSSLEKAVATELGGEGKLTDRQSDALTAAYIQAARNPDFLDRHEQGDPTLVEEFAKAWVEDWIAPARRKVTADEVDRARRVPSGKDRSIPAGSTKKVDFKDSKSVEDAMVASWRSHGGTFEG